MKKRDLTQGIEWQAILVFSVPIVLGNLLQQLYNTVDGIVVGNYIDSNALSAVGNCTTIASFLVSFAVGISSGCGIAISQFYGSRREKEVRATAFTGACLVLGIGMATSLIGVLCYNRILIGVLKIESEAVLQYAKSYLRIYCAGLVLTYGYNIIAAALRAVGDSVATLVFLAIASLTNLVLDLLMVPKFGISGAAVATVISQAVCFAASLLYMYMRYPVFRLHAGEKLLYKEKLTLCLQLGIPAALQQCSVSLGQVAMQRLVNHFGEITMSAFAVGSKIDRYVLLPIMGLHLGVSTFTGQNLGAGRPDRVQRGMYQAQLTALSITLVLSILVCIFAETLALAFGLQGEEVVRAVQYVRFCAPCALAFSLYFICAGLLQGSGDVVFATFVSLSSLLARIVFAYIMTYQFNVDYQICWTSILLSYIWSVAFAWWRYFSGYWRTKSKRIISG